MEETGSQRQTDGTPWNPVQIKRVQKIGSA
jgi:hypothetical protein